MTAGYDIIVIPGASNSSGRGLGDFDVYDGDPAMDARIFQLKRGGPTDKTVIPAVEPLQHWTQNSACHGYGIVLGRLWAKKRLGDPERNVMLITAARGSTSILEMTGVVGFTQFFPDMVDRINAVLALPGEHRVVGWFESQVERDINIALGGLMPEWQSLMPDAAAYYERKLALIDAFRALDLPKLYDPVPMYFSMPCGTLWPDHPEVRDAFIQAIQDAADARDSCYTVATSGFETNADIIPGSDGHWAAIGLGRLAYTYFEKSRNYH